MTYREFREMMEKKNGSDSGGKSSVGVSAPGRPKPAIPPTPLPEPEAAKASEPRYFHGAATGKQTVPPGEDVALHLSAAQSPGFRMSTGNGTVTVLEGGAYRIGYGGTLETPADCALAVALNGDVHPLSGIRATNTSPAGCISLSGEIIAELPDEAAVALRNTGGAACVLTGGSEADAAGCAYLTLVRLG